ncbi:MAG: substrate-binding domain-containing protein [Candidatus Marinimicrobia bacterium]|nr:substrate-binding domain-containing protein [Candidatus Neomarinimicrobiota bacterium]
MNTYMLSSLLKGKGKSYLPAILFSLLLLLGLECCHSDQSKNCINLYCYSAMKDVMLEGIIPAFQEMNKAQNNRNVIFKTNFRGSVELTCDIVTQKSADIAIFASEIDATILINRGVLAEKTWLKYPHNGTIAQSPILIIYNPDEVDDIKDFGDLSRPSVKLIHPSPLHSGLGQWGIMASYGSFLTDGDDATAMTKLNNLWQSVSSSPTSALMARDLYTRKMGNAMITYESELMGSSSRQVMDGTVCVPPKTIICEPLVVVIQRERSPLEEKLIMDFQKFLWSDRAQQIFVEYGFRSVTDRLNALNKKFVQLDSTFTMEDLGGAKYVKSELIEERWQNQIRRRNKAQN